MATPSPLEAIFFAALEKGSPAERASYLGVACGDDCGLRERIERMLTAQAQAGTFLEVPAAKIDRTIDQPISEKPGTVIGRYKLLEEIAQGGMGMVYRAEQQSPMRREVALKIIKPGMDTRQVIARFEAERQALALMDHPNIAKVYDAAATDSGKPYFVMELVHGLPLTDYCDQNQLTTRQRLELFVQVCHAVEHAHQKGIIHRDLKPSHMLVTLYNGVPVPKIIDFGIAKAITGQLTEEPLVTSHGQMIGTPLYMSPEQVGMDGLDADTRSDIYSLGVVLYELLTGCTPFDQERAKKAGYDEIRRMIRQEEPPPPSARLTLLSRSRLPGGPPASSASTSPGPARQAGPTEPELSVAAVSACRKTQPDRLRRSLRGPLDWIVMTAIQKDRTRRYQTATDFALDIRRYLNNEPIEARSPTLFDRAAKWSRRHRALVWSVLVLLFLATVTLSASTALIAHAHREAIEAYEEKTEQLKATERAEELANQQRDLARQQERLADQQRQEAVRQREISDGNLYVAHMRLAPRDWEQGLIGRLREMLDSHIPQPGRPDLRGWEWYYYFSLCHKELMSLGGDTWTAFGMASVAWSRDGKRLASADDEGTIQIRSAATGREILKFSTGKFALGSVAWSPNGERLATGGGDNTASIWDAATGKEVFTFHGFNAWVRSVAWSPDGLHLAAGDWGKEYGKHEPNTVKVWDATKGQEIVDLKGKAMHPVAWSPDGKRLATGKENGKEPNFQILDAFTGRELRCFSSLDGGELSALAWSPDGKRLASGEHKWARVWDADTGRKLLTLDHSRYGHETKVAWSPDGKRLATTAEDERITVWDATTGKETNRLQGLNSNIDSLAWSPDGTRLAFAGGLMGLGGTLKIFGTPGKQEPLTIDCAHAYWLAWSPKGDRVASAGDGRVKLWDPRTGEEVWSLDVPVPAGSADWGAAWGSLVWSADGKYLAARKHDSVVIMDTETRQRIVTLPTNGYATISWSPAGARLAIITARPASPQDVEVWDISTGKKVVWHCYSAETHSLRSLAWSPDGSRLALGEGEGSVTVWDTATAKRLLVLPDRAGEMEVSTVAWSPDGRRLASGSWETKTLTIWDTATAKRLLVLPGRAGAMGVLNVAWSPDGRRLASVGNSGQKNVGRSTVTVWDTSDGHEMPTPDGHTQSVNCVAWTRDGKRLATAGADNAAKIWDPSSGQELFSLVGYYLAWSPDGKQLAVSQEGAIRIYDASSGYALARGPGHQAEANRPQSNTHIRRGRTYGDAGQLDQAIACYNDVIWLDPKDVLAYQNRLLAWLEKGGYPPSKALTGLASPGRTRSARRGDDHFIVPRTRHGNETTRCCFLQSRKGMTMFDNVRYLTRGGRSEGRSRKPRQQFAPHHRRLVCEVLEARTLLSASPLPFVQQAKLTVSDGVAAFGSGVAISGNTFVAIGANGSEADVFTASGSVWTQTAKLTASGGAAIFSSVAIGGNGNTVVAGAIAKGAYVFTEPTNGWANMTQQTATLTAFDGVLDGFGRKVSINEIGDTVVVGAQAATVGGVANQGAAYVFTEPSNGWASEPSMTQTAKLTVSGTQDFGLSVANSGNTVVVTAEGTAGTKHTAGLPAAFVFTESGSVWTQNAELTASVPTADFGLSVSISGNTVVVGAPATTVGGVYAQGAVFVFTEPVSGWANMTQQTAELINPDGGAPATGFGFWVSISGNMVVVGDQVPGSKLQVGAAYVFTGSDSDSVWTQTARLTGSDVAGDTDGYSSNYVVSISSNSTGGYTVVAGTPVAAESGYPAAVYVFGQVNLAVTGVSSTELPGTYGTGVTIPITLTFNGGNDPVTVTGTPQLLLNDDGVASYVSGSGTPNLTFNYTVATGENTADLDYASIAALTLNGGSIVDSAGNVAALTLPTTLLDGLATQNIVIETSPPTVTSLSPTSGSTSGGTAVTITGTNLAGATGVDFGSVTAKINSDTDTQITATSPAGTAGTVDVTVVTPGGTSATSSADQFTYVAPPAVTGISPKSGSTSGGTSVTITGTGFTGATLVDFGTVAASSFTVTSATQIMATSPAGTGTVNVTVVALGGTSATSSADQFSYTKGKGGSSSSALLAGTMSAAMARPLSVPISSVAGATVDSPASPTRADKLLLPPVGPQPVGVTGVRKLTARRGSAAHGLAAWSVDRVFAELSALDLKTDLSAAEVAS